MSRWNWINEMGHAENQHPMPTSHLCPYELDFFMEKHGPSRDAAEVILHTNGPSRGALRLCGGGVPAFQAYA
jgi:hypothetical protein